MEWPFLKELQANGESVHLPHTGLGSPGSRLDLEVSVHKNGGEFLYLYLRETNGVSLEEQRLKEELRHRHLLAQEINHRVKNNLAIVSSLISLKTAQLGDPDLLEDLRLQIEAIRSIHHQLIENDSHMMIGMRNYLTDIVGTACTAYACRHVDCRLSIDEIELDSKQAAAVALILNELVTNAGKYAFRRAADHHELIVEFHSEGDSLALSVENSGPPLAADFEPGESEGLGMRLICALTNELQGELILRKGPTPRFTVRFPDRSKPRTGLKQATTLEP